MTHHDPNARQSVRRAAGLSVWDDPHSQVHEARCAVLTVATLFGTGKQAELCDGATYGVYIILEAAARTLEAAQKSIESEQGP